MAVETTKPDGISTLKIESTSATALTPGQLVWRRFRKHKMALAGGVGNRTIADFHHYRDNFCPVG